MAMKTCPVCGEKYSETYKTCPFCEEEEALREGGKPRRGGRRRSREYSLITPILIVLIILMAALLVYLLYGSELVQRFGGKDEPGVVDTTPGIPDGGDDTQPPEGDGQTPDDGEGGVIPTEPGDTTEPPDGGQTSTQEPPVVSDYDKAAQLPDGLSLNFSPADFTLRTLGETATIRVTAGGSGTYTWISQDPGVVSVDSSGKVTAVSGGTTNVLVTDGTKKAVCIVRVTASGTLQTGDNGDTATSGLKAGAAVVVNGGNGVRVRSGPGTNYDILASVPNGADVQVVKSAGNDWYEITFSGVGGVTTTGYMKGEFLANK